MSCACEFSPTGKVMSVCGAHADHVRASVEMTKHPRGAIVDKELRDRLLVAAMPTACERMARGDTADAVAEQTERLVHEIMRRTQ